MRIAMGTSRAVLPVISSRAVARGPWDCLLLRVYCPYSGNASQHPNTARMTARRTLRYKNLREEYMQAGDRAPDFSLPDQNGKKLSLKDFRGKTVVLFFFP